LADRATNPNVSNIKEEERLMKNIIIALSLFATQIFATTYIQAENTKGKYIRANEVQSGEYSFEECVEPKKKGGELKCSKLFKDGRTFRRYQLREVVERNERNMYKAAAADVVIVAASLYFGWILAAKASAAYYVAAGYSLDGGVAAAGGAIVGTPAGSAFAATVTVAVDELDPFVHRDMSIAIEDVMDEASKGDLEDVEAEKYRDGKLVVIEDIDYSQLKKKMIAQLEDVTEEAE
jgi:hypothetical protein